MINIEKLINKFKLFQILHELAYHEYFIISIVFYINMEIRGIYYLIYI